MESIARKLWRYLPCRLRLLIYGLASRRTRFHYRANQWTKNYHRDLRLFS
jgi:hypothetical protein